MTDDIQLAPVARADRIDVLDILRGFAILGIFYMNIPFMGASVYMAGNDIRSIGWSVADRNSWAVIEVLLEGTQRGLLEFLFGAGMMVLARRAMEPDGPVAVADLYYRRNIWLLLFGLFDVFILLWPGDILHVYAIAALFLFPFRRLAPQWLLALGLSFAMYTAITGAVEYVSRSTLQAQVIAINERPAGTATTPAQRDILKEWQKKLDRYKLDQDEQKRVDEERKARTAGTPATEFIPWIWSAWFKFVGKGSIVFGVSEALSAMLIGVALWKWRIIQGGRDRTFYLKLMLAAYAFGFGARALGVWEIFHFSPMPKTVWFTSEFARLATALGHVALVNLLVRMRFGAKLLSPFRAAGRTAFSLYFLEQIVGIILFAPFAAGLWAKWSYAGLAAVASATIAALLIVANLWSRWFVSGPFEWVWRSLSYLERQPFRRVGV